MDFNGFPCVLPSFMMIFDTVSDTILFAYIVQKLREEKDEKPTIYTRACGFVETLDRFVGFGCTDDRKKDPFRGRHTAFSERFEGGKRCLGGLLHAEVRYLGGVRSGGGRH